MPDARKRVFKMHEIRSINEATREVDFVASDESVDRYGDIIRASGWDLGNFKRNPVVLFAHDTRSPPIGTATVSIEKKELLTTVKFLAEGIYDFADTVWRIVAAKALRAVSVGFMPTLDPNVIRDDKNEFITGFEYIAQELLEISIVPVPANANALRLSKDLNLSTDHVKRLFSEQSASAFLLQRRREIDLIRLRDSSVR